MPYNDAMNHSDIRSRSTIDAKQFHEKNCPLKVGGNEVDRRSENICKKNSPQFTQNTNAAQQDTHREICPLHQVKAQSENNQKTETPGKISEKKGSVLNECGTVTGNKTSKIFCSCACCESNNEEIENTLKELQNQIQNLTAELSNSKTENQLLRKDINRAKHVVKREIGRNVETFEDLVKRMTEDSWIGQQEKIVSLKKELRVLKEELKEKGLQAPSPVKRHESVSPEQVPNDRKVHWRLKLERQSILRQTKRGKQDLFDDRDRLKEKCEGILNRNKELEEQVNSIRQELKETKKESNGNLISRLQEIEKKTKFCLDEKSRLRRSVEEEETKENQLLNQIEELENEIKYQQKTIEISKETLSRKKSDENEILSSLTTFESETSSGLRDIDKNLNQLDGEHKTNVEHLNLLIDLLFEFEELFTQQRQRSPSSKHSDDEINCRTFAPTHTFNKESHERVQEERTDSINEWIPTTTAKEIMQVKRESIVENAETVFQDTKEKLENILADDDQQLSAEESVSLKDGCNRFVKLFKDKEKENLKKSEHIYDLLDGIKEKTEEMLKNNSQLWKIASHIKTMLYKNKKLRKFVKNYTNEMVNEQRGFCHTTWDALINKGESVFNILGKENKFLKMLINKLAESKAYDFDLYTCACKEKETFIQKIPTANKC